MNLAYAADLVEIHEWDLTEEQLQQLYKWLKEAAHFENYDEFTIADLQAFLKARREWMTKETHIRCKHFGDGRHGTLLRLAALKSFPKWDQYARKALAGNQYLVPKGEARVSKVERLRRDIGDWKLGVTN